MAPPVILGGPELGLSGEATLGNDIFSTPIPAVADYQPNDLLWCSVAGLTEFNPLTYTGAAYHTADSLWASGFPDLPPNPSGLITPPSVMRLHGGNAQPLDITNREEEGGSFVASTHMMAFRKADQIQRFRYQQIGEGFAVVYKAFGDAEPNQQFTLVNDVSFSTPRGAIALLAIYATRTTTPRAYYAPGVYFSGITSTVIPDLTLVANAGPTAFHNLYMAELPSGSSFPELSNLATFTMGRGIYGLGTGYVLIEAMMEIFTTVSTTIPPLRQRQRDDGTRIRGVAGNNPSSKQNSVRQGWKGTYL